MAKITALRPGKGRRKRINVFLDGKFAFSLDNNIVASEKLQVEQVLSADQISVLNNTDNFQHCLDAAFNFLSYRPRSESEIREKIRQRGFDIDTREAVIAKLKEQGFVDDIAFARFWQDNRQSFSPRSRWLTRMELKRKGVAEAIIDQVVSTVDDADCAYQAALSKARKMTLSDYQSYRRQLGGYLRRRGFNYEIINKTVKQTWQELTKGSLESDSE